MSQTKQLSSVPAVAAVGEGDKIPIVNSSGQTVLVPLSGLLAAVKVGGRNLVRSTIYSADIPGARHTNGKRLNKSFDYSSSDYVSRIDFTRAILEPAYYAASFWIKTTGTSTTLPNVDINDCPIATNLTVGPEWQYVEGVVMAKYINRPYGFIDFNVPNSHENEVIISDLTVVQGNVPLQEWTPAPEDWGG